MSLPREPRQKMINMMYLVLTALLALNVSAEILNAFKTVNNSLEKTNTVVNASSNDLMSSLKDKLNEPGSRERASIWYPKAEAVQGFAKLANDYIQGVKDDILTKSGGDPKNPTKNYKDDNLDVPTRIMIDKGSGKMLLEKLTEFRNSVLGIDPKVKAQFEQSLPIDLAVPKSNQKSNKSWAYAYFHMVPSVAALTILSKFQNDVKVSENKVISFCHEQVGKVEMVFNKYEPIIGQNSKVLLPGQELEITAGLAAFNSDKKPDVYINGSKITLNEKGLADWKNTVNSSGKVPVRVEFTDQEGKPQTRSFDVEYTVGQSNAAVQLDKMNVLFIGVDNPITISGSGSVDQLSVSAQGGGAVITGGTGGHRSVRVSSETDECIISVRTVEGKVTPIRFRVRSIPDPTPYVGQVKSGEMSASAFKSQAGVRAIVDNFFYETQFNVTSFRMTGDGEGFPEGVEEKINTGAAWKEAIPIISKCRAGSFITIEDIRAVGPDGRTRKLTPMIFNLK